MSRGPLEVLRDMRADAACSAPTCQECKEYDEAIAQVEALVEALQELRLEAGNLRDETIPCDTLGRVDDALAPFTPGQDSEGGHGR